MYKKYLLFLMNIICILNASPKIGFGLEFVAIPGIIVSDDTSPSVYVPIIFNDLLIEPEFSYYSQTEEIDYIQAPPSYINTDPKEISTMIIGCGFYKLFNKNKVRHYSGIKLGYGLISTDPTSSYSTQSSKGTLTLIAPTSGAEYIISNHFTIGGEIALNIFNSEMDIYDSDESLYNTVSETMYIIRPKLLVRFYF